MAQILDDVLENVDDEKYAEYLEEARRKIDPEKIPDDEDGLIWWFYRNLYADCRKHELTNRRVNYNEELKLAAESQVICEILTARENMAIAI